MKKASYIICVFILCFYSKAYTQYAPYVSDNKSLLWKISGKSMRAPSYLFGTIHLICPDDYVWTKHMQRSLNETKEVCFEMDMDEPGLMMQVATSMNNESGKKLREYFTETKYKRLVTFFSDSLGISPTMLDQLKPAALQTIASARLVSCPVPMSYETSIMAEAQKTDKYITGLEEVSEQASLLNSVPEETIIADLTDIIDNYSDRRQQYQQVVNLYKKQDLPALYDMILESSTESDNIDNFLGKRNEKWISRMVEKMDQQPVFFAVGAGHLWGDTGLISLLRNEGYTVTPVKK